MKRVLLLIVTLFVALIFFGCITNKKDSIVFDDSVTFEEEEIKFKIEQILFSKSFQSIDSSVEIITNNNKLKVLASLGLAEYSEVNINKVVKKGSEVNIHVSGIYDKKNVRLAVPQVIMEINKSKLKETENLKFKIVYDDYTPLKVKFSINDVLNKLESHFKISLKGSPTFELIKLDQDIVWNIYYKSIFDKESADIPLVNLFAQVNANSGDIITSEKAFISSTLDDGHILNYIPNDYLLYKKSIIDPETDKTKEQLWFYDAKKDEKTMLYSSNFKIIASQFNLDLNYVSLIEVSDNGSEVYMIALDDKKAYKLSFENKFNPKIMRWKSGKILYLVDNNNRESVVYSHNIENNETKIIGKFDKDIENLYIKNNNFLIVEKSDVNFNKRISITEDWQDFNEINHGFNPKFIDDRLISYIKKDKKEDHDLLIIYDLETKKTIRPIEGNIVNYIILQNKDIAYVEKNINNNTFSLSKYSLKDKKVSAIANLIGDRVYYDDSRNIVYLNMILPFDNDKTKLIYSIDLDKLD